MKEIVADTSLIARCGLYCGACRKYRKGKCPGCSKNTKASWCKVRECCMENGYSSCADCTKFEDPKECGKFHSFVSIAIGFVLRSDRRGCIMQIRNDGLEAHAEKMAANKQMTLRP